MQKVNIPTTGTVTFTAFVAVATEVAVATAADVMMLLKPLSLAGELP